MTVYAPSSSLCVTGTILWWLEDDVLKDYTKCCKLYIRFFLNVFLLFNLRCQQPADASATHFSYKLSTYILSVCTLPFALIAFESCESSTGLGGLFCQSC